MTNTLLDRAVIMVTGEDAEKLLNDTLTGRIGLMGLEGRWFALLSPQGKVLVEGLVTQADGAFWLDVHRSVVEAFLKRMKMYRLRAKVIFEDVTESTAVWWSAAGELPPPTSWLISYSDKRDLRLWRRYLLPRPETAALANHPAEYDSVRIEAGLLELGADFGPDEVFAHDIGLDILDGIDFAKGCYVGQEVVSRMKHRGTARRRPVIVSGIDAPAGTSVIAGGRDAGAIGQVVDGKAVAILRLDRITDPAAVTVDGKPVTVTLPVWATYQFGDAVAGE